MERIITKIDGASSKEFVKGTYILDYVALVVGVICIALYVFFGIKDANWLSGLQILTIGSGLLLVILAIVLLASLNKAIKKADEFARTIAYEFEDEHLIYAVYRNEEIIENGKLPYSDLTRYKESKNYVFVGLNNNTWFAMNKVEGLTSFLESKGIYKKVVKVKK